MILLAPLNLPIAVMDSVLAVHLSISAHHQTGYGLHDKSQCSDMHNLQRPPGANESFFETAARLNSTATRPEAICQSFVIGWQYGIAIA